MRSQNHFFVHIKTTKTATIDDKIPDWYIKEVSSKEEEKDSRFNIDQLHIFQKPHFSSSSSLESDLNVLDTHIADRLK